MFLLFAKIDKIGNGDKFGIFANYVNMSGM